MSKLTECAKLETRQTVVTSNYLKFMVQKFGFLKKSIFMLKAAII